MQDAFEAAETDFDGENGLTDAVPFRRRSRRCAARRLDKIRSYVPSGRLLEVGPGTGELLQEGKVRGYLVAGVEYAPRFADRLRTTLGVRVHCGMFEEMDLSGEKYDAVVSAHVIEHTPDPIQHLQAARRATIDGGYLYLATPNVAGWGSRLAGNRWCGYSTAHLSLFTSRGLSLSLERTGWQVIDAHTTQDAYGWLRVLAGMTRKPRCSQSGSPVGSARDWSPCLIEAMTRVFAVLSWPFRRLQVTMGGGNELIFIARAVS